LTLADWDLAGAEAELLRPDRNSASAPNMLANVRAAQGRYEEALRLQKEAVARDPAFGIFRRNLASRLISLGRLEEAEAELRKAVEWQPQAAGVHYDMVVLAVLRGQADVAWHEAQLESPGFFRDTAIALAQAARGDRTEADAALKALVDARGEDHPFWIARVYAYRKETDKVFEWLDRAYTLRDPRLISLLADPLLRPYHSDPRFTALRQKMGLPVPK
jgi:tetratricopeptide (TPR) repeat protein